MKGSLKIATAFNIPVYVHWSFILIIGYVLYESIASGQDMVATFWSVVLILGLFFCVVLHEYGHALAAKRYGVGTRSIVLYPIGGVASLERMPKKPMQELIVAIAGPMVNVLIVLLLSPYFLVYSFDSVLDKIAEGNSASTIIPFLIIMNIVLVVFNMIPAFPMDGGRVFRALLSMKFNRVKATLVAARLGQLFSLGFIYYGFTSENSSPFTAFIGFFIFMMANNEYKFVKFDAALSESKVADIMREEFTKFLTNDPLYMAVNQMDKGAEHSFLVFDLDENLVGILEEKYIKKAIKEGRVGSDVRDNLSPNTTAVEPQMPVSVAYNAIADGYSILPVMVGNDIVGVIDARGLKAFLKSKGL